MHTHLGYNKRLIKVKRSRRLIKLRHYLLPHNANCVPAVPYTHISCWLLLPPTPPPSPLLCLLLLLLLHLLHVPCARFITRDREITAVKAAPGYTQLPPSLPPLLLSISVESPLSSVRAGQARPMRQSTSQSVNHCTLIEGINYPASCTQSSCQRGPSLG